MFYAPVARLVRLFKLPALKQAQIDLVSCTCY